MHALTFLSWRTLRQHRLRTILSALAVALGTATVVAAEVTGAAIRSAGRDLTASQDTVAFAGDMIENALGIMGLAILAVAAFLILNAFGMAVTQRQQQIGMLRAVGLTRRQVMGWVLLEALAIGGVGTLLGIVVGPFLGHGLLALLAELASFVYSQTPVAFGSLLQAVLLGLGTTLLATLAPAWRATRVSPLAALRPPETTGREQGAKARTIAGLGLIATLLATLLLRPPATTALPPPWDLLLTGLFLLGWLAGLGLLLPALIHGVSSAMRRLGRRLGAAGRLAADNLERARGRVLLTTATLALALMAIVGVMGITTFLFKVVMNQVISAFNIEWIVAPIERSVDGSIVNWKAVSQWDLETMQLAPELIAELEQRTAGRARLVHVPEVVLPELAVMSGLPSIVGDPAEIRAAGFFSFSEGNWETAQPLMEAGCGLLLTPRMAHQHGVGLGDTLVLSGVSGPVTCTVAGLGTSIFMGSSIVSKAAGPAFGLEPGHVFMVVVQPLPGTEKSALRADLESFLKPYLGNSIIDVEPFFEDAAAMVGILQTMLNGMLLLAMFLIS